MKLFSNLVLRTPAGSTERQPDKPEELENSIKTGKLPAAPGKLIKQVIDCNWTRTQNHLVLKRTLNQFGQMVECSFKN